MNHQLDEKVFTLSPSLDIAAITLNAYKKKALTSIKHIAAAVINTMKIEQKPVNDRLKILEDYTLSTLLYIFNTKLINALIHQRDVKAALQILKEFSEVPLNELISLNQRIHNLNKFTWALEFASESVKTADRINGEGYAVMQAINKEQLLTNTKIITEALSIIKTSPANSFYKEISHLSSDIILFKGKGIMGGTSTRVMGSIFIRIPSPPPDTKTMQDETSLLDLPSHVYYLEQLIHETSHLYLDQLMELDPLVLNKHEDRFDSPIRKDMRPMRAVFHATFVLARLCLAFAKLNSLNGVNEVSRSNRLKTLKLQLSLGIRLIENHGILTRHGKKILLEMSLLTKNELNDTI